MYDWMRAAEVLRFSYKIVLIVIKVPPSIWKRLKMEVLTGVFSDRANIRSVCSHAEAYLKDLLPDYSVLALHALTNDCHRWSAETSVSLCLARDWQITLSLRQWWVNEKSGQIIISTEETVESAWQCSSSDASFNFSWAVLDRVKRDEKSLKISAHHSPTYSWPPKPQSRAA